MPDAFASLEDQDIDSRVVLDYTSRDFTAIRSQLVGLARGLMPDWQTAGEASDFGTLLLEIFAYMGDVIHFYIDRTASEAFLGSAIRQQSVLYIANMLGYTPIGQQSASVTLVFKMDGNATAPVTIPKGTLVHNSATDSSDLIVFETDLEVTLDPTVVPQILEVTGYATEGVTVDSRLLGVCSGAPSTEFVIPDKGVIYGSISVVSREGVQLVDWTYVANLSLARPTQPMFTSFRDDQNYTHLIFGDNAAGRVPPVNAEIYVTYRYGVGAVANTLAVGAVNVVVNNSTDDWWAVSVSNSNSPVGGADPESADAMRQSIPRAAARIKNRAITLHDYADMALQVPGVAKSVAHGTVYTAVRVKIAPVGGLGTDVYLQRLCAEVEDYMADKVIVGSTVYAEPNTMDELWQDVYIQIFVHVQKGYNRTSVRVSVDATVRQVFAFDSVDFGTRVTIGQVYRSALAVQGVEWAEVRWLNVTPPVDDTDPEAGDTTEVLNATWLHNNTLSLTGVTAGHYQRNATVAPTSFAFSTTDADGFGQDLTQVNVGDHLVYRPELHASSWMSFIVNGALTTATGIVLVPVLKLDQALTVQSPAADDRVTFSFIRYTPTPDSLGGVLDIETDELLIPRITPLPAIIIANISQVAMASSIATITTASAHGMTIGQTIDVAGATPTMFNGEFTILDTPTTTTLRYSKPGAPGQTPVASTGSITTVNLPESPTDYPDLSEDERTHDGLWVIADGGLLGS